MNIYTSELQTDLLNNHLKNNTKWNDEILFFVTFRMILLNHLQKV